MKKVTVEEGRNQVHPMITWAFAYKDARKKYWELMALDRWRFSQRIGKADTIITPILEYAHRINIYKARFEIKTISVIN